MSTETVQPKPISSHDVAWTDWSEVPRFGVRYRHLTRAAVGEDYRVGVAIEELMPGKQSSPAHYHVFEEEHVFVLEGALSVRIGAETHPMTVGSYVCFPAGQKAGHCLVNTSDAPCRYVIVGENNPNEVVVYTDSQKVLVRALGRRALFDLAARRGYWDGEDTGLAVGQAPPADDPPCDAAPGNAIGTRPKPPISSDAVGWDEEGPGEGTRFGGHSKHLTFAAAGWDYRVGLLLEAPSPGMRLAPLHYHTLEEEHALILEGQVTLLSGAERFEMQAGDYVCFPAGRAVGHSFMNSGPGPCRYLMIGERNPNDVCVLPESNKMEVRGLRTRGVFHDMAAVKRYWDGEPTG